MHDLDIKQMSTSDVMDSKDHLIDSIVKTNGSNESGESEMLSVLRGFPAFRHGGYHLTLTKTCIPIMYSSR